MALYRVGPLGRPPDAPSRLSSRAATILVVVFVVALSVPLAGSTARIVDERLRVADVEGVASGWAAESDWEVVSVEPRQGRIVVRAVGELPSPEPAALRAALDDAGLGGVDVRLELIPQANVELPATG